MTSFTIEIGLPIENYMLDESDEDYTDYKDAKEDALEMSATDNDGARELAIEMMMEFGCDPALCAGVRVVATFIEHDSSNPHHGSAFYSVEFSGPDEALLRDMAARYLKYYDGLDDGLEYRERMAEMFGEERDECAAS